MQRSPQTVLTARCPAGRPDGWQCPRLAGFGTDHPGIGKCRQHDLEEAAAARAEHAKRIPQAVFVEARYVDGLPYHDTAPGLPFVGDEDDEGPAD
ncbi:hypothetical protein PV569_33565 [Streptomyces scabiei]|uniref:hypothetical protein n=1 Tax=Streptomyces TaxID=1883 RepID=UPI0029AB61BC|nr:MULTISPECIES: hypothetical protein [Streptomyces]MDX3298592.1 hypothetical protein [Streptomyces scabiei]MDX3672789.1 hypothetical protein [Streptomyces europaeiscabiei]